MIDLHTHTNASDGTLTPAELVREALAVPLEALAICDHDTFAGYDAAAPLAAEQGLDLVCGIELSTKLHVAIQRAKTVHMLGYFLRQPPSSEFREWLGGIQAARRDRNVRMVERLRLLGVDIAIEEVERIGGSIAGRPHFARLLVEKGYVQTSQEAFDEYLDESAKGYVEREEPSVEEGIRRIREAGGLSSLAHPIRLGKRNHDEEESLIAVMVDAGLQAIEVYHSDHSAADVERYLSIARRYGLIVTGGSDFHGANKPSIRLGLGYRNNIAVPRSVLEEMRARATSPAA
ncbi:MAG: PHP domain-containing protein [Bryobacteraceae bacterium]